jgi:hypothetical protein
VISRQATLSDLAPREQNVTVGKVQAKDLKEYKAFFKEIKEKILTSQIKRSNMDGVEMSYCTG